MKISVTTRHFFPVAPEHLFDFTNDAANFTSFVGFGPVPGIKEAKYETDRPPGLGSRRTILKTDGTVHLEEIVVFQRPSRHSSRITGLAAPFSWLVRWGEDDWRFQPFDARTVVERTFAFELTSPLAAIVAFPLLHLFMRAAVKRDLRNIEQSYALRAV